MIYHCQWAGCHAALAYKGTGRKPKYCDPHKAAAKKAQDEQRCRSKLAKAAKLLAMKRCCKAAHEANHRVRKCPQCKQWEAFKRDTGRTQAAIYAESSEQWQTLVAVSDAMGRGADRGFYVGDITTLVQAMPDPDEQIAAWAYLSIRLAELWRKNGTSSEGPADDELAEDNALTDELDSIGTALAEVNERMNLQGTSRG